MWKSRKLDLTIDEVARLLPLVKRTSPYFERMASRAIERRRSLPIITNAPAKADEGPRMPRELSEALRETTYAIAAAHGYEDARVGWSFDGKAVSVSVSVEIPDGQAGA